MKQNRSLQALLTRLRTLWADEKKRTYLLLAAGLAGMLLICISEWMPASPAAAPAPETSAGSEESSDYAASLEQRLTELIGQMEGAGRTRVMVTLASGGTTQYATDTEDTADSSRRQHVLLGDGGLVEQVQTILFPVGKMDGDRPRRSWALRWSAKEGTTPVCSWQLPNWYRL